MHNIRTESVQQLARTVRGGLRALIRSGSSTATDFVFATPEVLNALRSAGIEDGDSELAERATSALRNIVRGMPEERRLAAEIMLGLDDQARGLPLRTRRAFAAEAVNVQPETFRAHHEPKLLDDLAQQLAVELLRLKPAPPAAAGGRDGDWHRWSPEAASNPSNSELARLVDEFQGLDTPSGRAAAEWLKTESLNEFPGNVTHIYVANKKLQGFYSMKGGIVQITPRLLERLNPRRPRETTAGASVVEWMARHRDADPMTEPRLVTHAIGAALAVGELQGSDVLVVRAGSEGEADSLAERYGFLRFDGPGASEPYLWFPIRVGPAPIWP